MSDAAVARTDGTASSPEKDAAHAELVAILPGLRDAAQGPALPAPPSTGQHCGSRIGLLPWE